MLSDWLKNDWGLAANGSLNNLAKLCEVLEGNTDLVIEHLNSALMFRFSEERTRNARHNSRRWTAGHVIIALEWAVKKKELYHWDDAMLEEFHLERESLGQLVGCDDDDDDED